MKHFREMVYRKIPGDDHLGIGLMEVRTGVFLACWRNGRACQPNCAAYVADYINIWDNDKPEEEHPLLVVRCRALKDGNIIGTLTPPEGKDSEGKLLKFPLGVLSYRTEEEES
jgi:hypothetical protein